MKMSVQGKVVLIISLLMAAAHVGRAQFSIDAEANFIARVPYNKVRIPAAGGTQFDIAQDLSVSTRFTGRLRLSYTIQERHVVSLLFAPLTIKSNGVTGQDINYSGTQFDGNEELNAKYKFNSYRLTYRYMLIANEKVNLGFGLTGKIREANIVISQGNKSADYPDLGFVPLVNFYFSVQPVDKLRLILEGDALASKQGRAEDIFAGLSYDVSERFAVKGGYRILEGGADVEKNYNFAWVDYIPVGIIWRL